MRRPDSRSQTAVWHAVVVDVPLPDHEELLALFATEALGVDQRVRGQERLVLRLWYSTSAEARGVRDRAEAWLSSAPGRLGQAPSVEVQTDDRWVERYRAGLKPFPLGRRFLVVPGEDPALADEREILRLPPGRAFGTGEHPTTRACTVLLEAHVGPGEHWIDLGCGSGILSVVAARLGAARVLALDVDPDAAVVARQMSRSNGVGQRVAVVEGSLSSAREGAWDGVVANIAGSFFLAHAAALMSVLGEGGLLIVSGFLRRDAEEVRAAIGSAAGAVVGKVAIEPWSALAFRRGS